jgi:thiamine pyrophosphokinase
LIFQQPSSSGKDGFILPQANRIIIFANGELRDTTTARGLIHADDYIICADGGTRHALWLGLQPNLIIGDMDSLTKSEWKKFEQANIAIELYPRDKVETDLELALRRAQEMNPRSICVIAALGGRIDQTLANLALFTSASLASIDLRADDGSQEAFFCRHESTIEGTPGDVVSLIPWNGPTAGVTTVGLRWALHNESLYPDRTRGISNEMIKKSASVSIASGLLLLTHDRHS